MLVYKWIKVQSWKNRITRPIGGLFQLFFTPFYLPCHITIIINICGVSRFMGFIAEKLPCIGIIIKLSINSRVTTESRIRIMLKLSIRVGQKPEMSLCL